MPLNPIGLASLTCRPAMVVAALSLLSGAAEAQNPLPKPAPLETGIWFDDTGAGAVEIYICADRADRLCGRIMWLKEPLNSQGVPKRDRYNPQSAMQNRPICGLPVLGNLQKMPEGGWDEGWVYDPKAGKSYNAAIQLASRDRLTLTGYVGIKFLSKTFTWTRAPAELPRCPGVAPPPQETKGPPPTAPATKAANVKVLTPPVPKAAVRPETKATPLKAEPIKADTGTAASPGKTATSAKVTSGTSSGARTATASSGAPKNSKTAPPPSGTSAATAAELPWLSPTKSAPRSNEASILPAQNDKGDN